jgi:hypothetical protein
MKMFKLLITSVGSLVGQNILDVLESPICSRRKITRVIGTNSVVENPQNFRCDTIYHVSNTNAEEFPGELISIIENEKPDLILNGRDEDTEIVYKIIKSNTQFKVKIPYGSLSTVQAALHKDITKEFCERYHLPFADTLITSSCDSNELHEFVNKYSFPLIAKPIEGFASNGVFYLRNWSDIEYIKNLPGYMIQEYLGNPEQLEDYFTVLDGPTPLFAHAPNIYHISCHTIIDPDGKINPIFISRNEHDSGVTVGLKKIFHPELESTAIRFAEAIAKENGYGPLTVQFRKNRDGIWKAQEMNMRTNGNTYPRFLMGQDDIGLLIRGLFPSIGYPVYEASELAETSLIGKSLTSYVMHSTDIENLRRNRYWP